MSSSVFPEVDVMVLKTRNRMFLLTTAKRMCSIVRTNYGKSYWHVAQLVLWDVDTDSFIFINAIGALC